MADNGSLEARLIDRQDEDPSRLKRPILCVCLMCFLGVALIAASADQGIAEKMFEKKACSKTWCSLHGYTEDVCRCGVCGSYGGCSWTCQPNATELKEYALLSCKTKSNMWRDVADAIYVLIFVLFLMVVIFIMWQQGSCGSKATLVDKTCTPKVIDDECVTSESTADDASKARSSSDSAAEVPDNLPASKVGSSSERTSRTLVFPKSRSSSSSESRPEVSPISRARVNPERAAVVLPVSKASSSWEFSPVSKLQGSLAEISPESAGGTSPRFQGQKYSSENAELSPVSKPQRSLAGVSPLAKVRSSSESLAGVSPFSKIRSCSETFNGVSPASKARSSSDSAAVSPASSSSQLSLVSMATTPEEERILAAYQERWDKCKLRIANLKDDLQTKVDVQVQTPRSGTEDSKRMLPFTPTKSDVQTSRSGSPDAKRMLQRSPMKTDVQTPKSRTVDSKRISPTSPMRSQPK